MSRLYGAFDRAQAEDVFYFSSSGSSNLSLEHLPTSGSISSMLL